MRRAALVAALAATVAAAADTAPKSSDHAAIPLLRPELYAPPEVASADVHPLVRATMAIDAAGKVTHVEVTAIEPPSPLDEVFRRAAVDELSTWRFAPAEKDGRPQPSETAVAIQFYTGGSEYAQPETPGRTLWLAATDAGFESARWSLRDKVLGLGLPERRKVADGIAATADRMIHAADRVSAANDWFEVVTDYGGRKQADAILNDCMETFRVLYDVLGKKIPPRPREERLRVYVFASRAQYETFARSETPFEGSEGVYCPAGVLAFHVEMPTPAFLIAALIHEATHAFVDRHLIRAGVHLPRWLDEGLAEYLGESDINHGTIVPGGHANRKQAMMTLDGTAFWQTPSRARSEVAQHAQRQKRALTLREILAANPETFYGKDVDLYYAQGWLAVHFLRHGRPGWADGEFPRFLLYVAEGYPAEPAFRTVYGASPDSLEAEYQRYVKKF